MDVVRYDEVYTEIMDSVDVLILVIFTIELLCVSDFNPLPCFVF